MIYADIPTETITYKLTNDSLPEGPKWEADGSCWKADKCDPIIFGVKWRWWPQNAKALAKDGPEGEMYDFHTINLWDLYTSVTQADLGILSL